MAANKFITACDIAHVPLKAESVDVAVFCLSLMGTGYAEYLREANRVLVPGGRLIIAEVRSRFESVAATKVELGPDGVLPTAKSATEAQDRERIMRRFVGMLGALGFVVKHESKKNKMFLLLQCKKREGVAVAKLGAKASDIPKVKTVRLKPCQYKRR